MAQAELSSAVIDLVFKVQQNLRLKSALAMLVLSLMLRVVSDETLRAMGMTDWFVQHRGLVLFGSLFLCAFLGLIALFTAIEAKVATSRAEKRERNENAKHATKLAEVLRHLTQHDRRVLRPLLNEQSRVLRVLPEDYAYADALVRRGVVERMPDGDEGRCRAYYVPDGTVLALAALPKPSTDTMQ